MCDIYVCDFDFILIEFGRLCVIGLAPHHVALKENGGIVSVDFNVGKSDRSGIKVTGKRKKVKSSPFSVFVVQLFWIMIEIISLSHVVE